MGHLTQSCLEWDTPLTSKQAAKYHLTAGFIPVELLGATISQLEKLQSAIFDIDKEIVSGIPDIIRILNIIDSLGLTKTSHGKS